MNNKIFNLKPAKLKVILLPTFALVLMLCGCDDRFDTIQPPGAHSSKSTKSQAKVTDVNTDKTSDFFKLATNKEPGDKTGLIELRNEGILIHPGESTPSKISFKVSHAFQKLSIRAFIAVLPDEASSIKEAGSAKVEFFLDGKSEGMLLVDRDNSPIKNLDLSNVDILTIVVDNSDGKAWFDWLMLGMVDSK